MLESNQKIFYFIDRDNHNQFQIEFKATAYNFIFMELDNLDIISFEKFLRIFENVLQIL